MGWVSSRVDFGPIRDPKIDQKNEESSDQLTYQPIASRHYF